MARQDCGAQDGNACIPSRDTGGKGRYRTALHPSQPTVIVGGVDGTARIARLDEENSARSIMHMLFPGCSVRLVLQRDVNSKWRRAHALLRQFRPATCRHLLHGRH